MERRPSDPTTGSAARGVAGVLAGAAVVAALYLALTHAFGPTSGSRAVPPRGRGSGPASTMPRSEAAPSPPAPIPAGTAIGSWRVERAAAPPGCPLAFTLAGAGGHTVDLEVFQSVAGAPVPPASAGGLAVHVVGAYGPTRPRDLEAAQALLSALLGRSVSARTLPAIGQRGRCGTQRRP